MKIRKPLFCALTMCSLFLGSAQAQSSDNGDGTFTNPMLWSDVPDPDVIRVDDNFYLVSTTMHLMPGAPVMRSKDLVNWLGNGKLFVRPSDRYPQLRHGRMYRLRTRAMGDFTPLL